MKYTFSYKEENFGILNIDTDHYPTREEVEDAIWCGYNVEIEKTRYKKIYLIKDDKKHLFIRRNRHMEMGNE